MDPIFLFKEPSPALRHIVGRHQIIRLRFGNDDLVPAKPYWPRPAIALAFYLRDPEWECRMGAARALRKPRAALIGQPTIMTTRQGGRDFSVYQIELRAGALHRLTGLPADQLTDRHLDAEVVFPPGFRALADAIADTEDPDTMIRLAERYLFSIDRPVLQRSAAAFEWAAGQLTGGRQAGIGALAAGAEMTPRHLHRLFLENAGVGPRMYGRIVRFDRAVRLLNKRPEEAQWEAAIDANYYDYQHMARDFRDFTGLSVTQFMAIEREAPERLFGWLED
jgi:AraC-like DNA-binding protein